MILGDLTRSAFRSLAANRLRTVLTMLGMIIGVSAVIAMIAMGAGARANATAEIRKLGTNLLSVRPGPPVHGPVRTGAVDTLKLEDAMVLSQLPGVVMVSPELSRSAQCKYMVNNASATIVGATPPLFTMRTLVVENGAGFTEVDVRSWHRVAVLGSKIAKDLFGGLDPVGEIFQIKGIAFTVVGVLAEKGEGWQTPDEQVIVPLTTLQKTLFGLDYLSTINVKYADDQKPEALIEDIGRLLRERHRIQPGDLDDFNVSAQTEVLAVLNQFTGVMTALLGGAAAISLLVGGIGIMNIMLVSVRERTREIGVRKAVGARRKDILFQFLVESVVVAVLGGLGGLLVGFLLAWGIAAACGWPLIVPLYAIILAVFTSGGIGVIFGVWPAREASRLDPVAALRFE